MLRASQYLLSRFLIISLVILAVGSKTKCDNDFYSLFFLVEQGRDLSLMSFVTMVLKY